MEYAYAPRLCQLQRSSGVQGFGFKLEYDKNLPGHTIVDLERPSPATEAGLQIGDEVVAVNDVNIQKASHTEAVEHIKAQGDRMACLVADANASRYFRQHGITPVVAMLNPKPTPGKGTTRCEPSLI